MDLALILLLLSAIVAAIGWAVFAGINKLDQATTPPPKPTAQQPKNR